MPKTVTLKITQSEKDAEYLRSLSATSKLAGKCTYVGTFNGRFALCYEDCHGKHIYYAVDMLSGRFSRITESSFVLSCDCIAREMGSYLVNAVKHTGCFNRVMGGGKFQKTLWATEPRV